jgi:hypothetical protein
MAVQLPGVQRMAPQATPSVGRTNLNLADRTEQMGKNTEQIVSIGEKVFGVMEAQEKAAIDLESQTAVNEFTKYHHERMSGPQGVKYQKGNPVAVYEKFDEDVKGKYEEIVGKFSTYSPKAKVAIQSALDKKSTELWNSRNLSYGQQFNQYSNDITNDTVKITQREMLDAAALIDPNDPDSFALYDSKLKNIMQTREQNAIRTGQLQVDESGQVVQADPAVQVQMAEDMSNGLKITLKSFYTRDDSRSIKTAEMLLDKYGAVMLPDHKVAAEEAINKAKKNVEAIDLVGNLDYNDAQGSIAKIEEIEDPETREKAMEKFEAGQRRRSNALQRDSKNNYNLIADIVFDRQASGQPFTSVGEFNDDPRVKQLIENVSDAKQRQALVNMVERPATSNTDKKNNAYSAISDGSLVGMDRKDFELMASGLNKQDYTLVNREWINANKATSESKDRSRGQFLIGQTTKQLESLGYISKNSSGKYSKEEKETLNRMHDVVLREMQYLPPTLEVSAQASWLKEVIKQEITNPGSESPKYKRTKVTGVAAPTVSQEPTSSPVLNRAQRADYWDRYVTEKGVDPKNNKELDDYITEQQRQGK